MFIWTYNFLCHFCWNIITNLQFSPDYTNKSAEWKFSGLNKFLWFEKIENKTYHWSACWWKTEHEKWTLNIKINHTVNTLWNWSKNREWKINSKNKNQLNQAGLCLKLISNNKWKINSKNHKQLHWASLSFK